MGTIFPKVHILFTSTESLLCTIWFVKTLDMGCPLYGLSPTLIYVTLCFPQLNIKIATWLLMVCRNVMWYCLNSIKRRADDRQLCFVSERFRFISQLGDRTTWQVIRTFFFFRFSQSSAVTDYTTTAPFPKILQLSKPQSTQSSTSYTTTRKAVSVVELDIIHDPILSSFPSHSSATNLSYDI